MTVYDTIDDVPVWDALSDFDTLTVAETGMVAGVLKLLPLVLGGASIHPLVLGGASIHPSVLGSSRTVSG